MFIISDKFKKIAKTLKLDKPLVIFDMETTGQTIYKDKIIELAYIKIYSDGRVKKDEMILDPQMPISRESTAVHGLSDKDVSSKPTFRKKAQEIWEIFNGCYYSGFNVMNFDLPILRREFIRVGMDFDYNISQIIDCRVIYQHMVPRSLAATYRYYCGKEFRQSHTALGDVEVSAEILVKQLDKYSEIRDLDFINKIHQSPENSYVDSSRKFYWKQGRAYFAFSKYIGVALSEVAKINPKFLKWILTADFSEETKTIVKKSLESIKEAIKKK
ncbi:3'-5' exonuclease [Patescibacteria group bacterium]|nr:3'-5' exonuclease [Patescibacteria group bacterium]